MEYIDLDKVNKVSYGGIWYTLYLVENMFLNISYIGITYSKSHPFDRKYSTSSRNLDFRSDYNDHPEWFRMSLLKYLPSIIDASDIERFLVTPIYLLTSRTYNKAPGGLIGNLNQSTYNRELNESRSRLGLPTSHDLANITKSKRNLARRKLGLPTSHDLSNHTKRKRDLDRSLKGEFTTMETIAINRKLNNSKKVSKGIIPSNVKSGLSKTNNLIEKEPWLNNKVKLVSNEITIFEGTCIDACKFLLGRSYLSDRGRVKDKFINGGYFKKRCIYAFPIL